MQRGQHLLGNSLDGNRVDVFVAAGFKDSLGVGAIGLVALHVGTHVMGAEEAPRGGRVPRCFERLKQCCSPRRC